MKDATHRALPINPTDQMVEAAYPLLSSMASGTPPRDKRIIRAIWAEMLHHSPKPIIQGLTKNQAKVHQFIELYIARHQLSPTYQEICDGCGLYSKSEAFATVSSLVRKKVLKRREKGQPRSIVLLMPTGLKPKRNFIFARGVTPRLRGPKNGT